MAVTVKHKDDRKFMEFRVGKKDPGLSKDFVFNAENGHEVTMSDADADKLERSGNGGDYTFTKAGADAPTSGGDDVDPNSPQALLARG